MKMEKLKLCIVTRSSSDEQFVKGDIIYLTDKNEIFDLRAGGWLSENEWNINDRNDFKVEECRTHHLLVLDRDEIIVNES